MDSRSKGVSWVSRLCQKTETFFGEVDDLITQESLKYVENQLLIAGKNVKQYCSEFIQDVLDMAEEEVPSSPGGNEKSVVLASEMIEELLNNSSLRNQHDTGMSIGIEQNVKAEKLFSYEIQEVIASPNEISVSCGMRQPNNKVSDDQVNLSTAVPKFLGDDPISESRGMSKTEDAKDDVSTLQPTILSAESHEPKSLDVGCDNANDSNDSSDRIHQYTKLGAPNTMPIGKLKLDDSCIIVDCNEICSASEAKHLYRQKYLRRALSSIVKFARERKPHNATLFEDLNEESDKQGGRNLTTALATAALESMDQEFCESEWEII